MAAKKFLTAPIATDKMPPAGPYIIGNEMPERFSGLPERFSDLPERTSVAAASSRGSKTQRRSRQMIRVIWLSCRNAERTLAPQALDCCDASQLSEQAGHRIPGVGSPIGPPTGERQRNCRSPRAFGGNAAGTARPVNVSGFLTVEFVSYHLSQ